jgi:hypothetical protein
MGGGAQMKLANRAGLSALFFIVPCVIVLCLGTTSIAFACNPDPSASFQDDFKKQDPQWYTGKNIYFADNQLAIKTPANQSDWSTYPSFVFKDATYCVDVKSPPDAVDPDTVSAGGLLFWQTGDDSFFTVQVYPDGNYGVFRKLPSGWLNVQPKTKFDKLNAGPGAVNEIKVTALNSMLTVFLNGEKAAELRAQAPKDGGTFGVFGESSQNQPNEWRFLDIVITQ